MSDVAEFRKGRNLAVLSFVIIVYAVSGANISEQGILGGVMLEFERPEVLEYAFFGFFVFSAHQFLLAIRNPLRRIKTLFLSLMWKDFKLNKEVDRRAQELLEAALKNGTCEILLSVSQQQIKARKPVVAQWKKSKDSKWRVTHQRGWFSLWMMALAKDTHSSHVGDFLVKVGWWTYSVAECKAYMKILVNHEEVWHDLFPLVLAACALVSVICNVGGWI